MIFITINLHTTPFEIAINLTYAKILVFTIFNHSSQTNLGHVSYFFHNLVSCFYKQDLLTDARAEKTALLEQLRAMLDQTSRKTQLEQQSSETDFIQKQLNNVPLPIYIF